MKKRQRAFVGAALAAAASGVFSTQVFAVDNIWVGTTTDWNTPTNWSLGRVPTNSNGAPTGDTFDDAVVNTALLYPIINADLVATPRDIVVGSGAGNIGRVDHTAGTAATGGGNWFYVGRDAGVGTYNLADTSGVGGTLTHYATGSGTVNVGGRVYVGGTEFGAVGAQGTLNVNTTGILNVSNDLNVGTDGGTGVMNVDAGSINVGTGGGGWVFIGKRVNADGANGTLNMSGGTLNNPGRTTVAQTNSVGKLSLSGGTYNNNATDQPFIVAENAGSQGTVELTTAASTLKVGNEMWVGQGAGATGVMNVSAGTVTVNNWIAVGREGATGTLNVSGGVVQKIGAGHITIGTGAGGHGNVNVSGGTLSTDTDMILGENDPAAVGIVNQSAGLVKVGGNLEVQRTGIGTYTLGGGVLSVDGFIDGTDGTFVFSGGRITRSNAGVVTYNGNLTVANKASGFVLNNDKTFNVSGVLDVTPGITFDVTGDAIPSSGAGSIHLGNDTSIIGTFDPATTTLLGLNNTPGATFISETQGEGGLYDPSTQNVFWVQENAGSIDLEYSVNAVPEPATLSVVGLTSLVFMARRRRK